MAKTPRLTKPGVDTSLARRRISKISKNAEAAEAYDEILGRIDECQCLINEFDKHDDQTNERDQTRMRLLGNVADLLGVTTSDTRTKMTAKERESRIDAMVQKLEKARLRSWQ